jgi:hypothetical protein
MWGDGGNKGRTVIQTAQASRNWDKLLLRSTFSMKKLGKQESRNRKSRGKWVFLLGEVYSSDRL